MSNNLIGIQYSANYNNLDGLSIIDADEIFIQGQPVDIDNLVPYTGATKTINLGAQNIQTTHGATAGADLVNLTTLQEAIAYIDITVGNTFLNKTTTGAQTVAGPITFNNNIEFVGGVECGQMVRMPELALADGGVSVWSITPGTVETSDMTFLDNQTSNSIIFQSTGKVQANGFIDNDATASRVAIYDVNRELTSSGTTSTELGYLSGVSSAIQTQLNTKATITYVDTQDALKVSKAGDTMTGTLAMGTNKITTSYVPVNGVDLVNKTYCDSVAGGASLTANNIFTGTLNTFNNDVKMGHYYAQSSDIVYTKTTDSNKWFKIATLTNVASGFFTVEWHEANHQGMIELTAGFTYLVSPFLQTTNITRQGIPIPSAFRIAISNTSGDYVAYLEMLTVSGWNTDTATIRTRLIRQDVNSNIALITTKTAGTTTGYGYYQVNAGWGGMDYNFNNKRFRWLDNGMFGLNTNGTVGSYCHITDGINTNVPFSTNSISLSANHSSYFICNDTERTTFLGSDDSGYGMVGTFSNHDFVIRANNSEKMRIATSGNVGIGKSAPGHMLVMERTADYVYHTIQNFQASGYVATAWGTDASWGVIFKNGSTRSADGGVNTMTVRNDGGSLRLQNNSSSTITLAGNGMFVDNGGDYTNSLCIRTSWPSVCLNGDNTTGRTWSILNGGSGAGVGQGNLGIYDNTAGTTAYRFAIDKDGRVCIGNPNTLGTQNVAVPKMLMVDSGGAVWNHGTRPYGQSFTISQDNSYTRYSAGLALSYTSLDYAWIVSLAPGVAWKDLVLAGNLVYICVQGSVSTVSYTWGIQNVSDERCKRDINSLKTSRSLERVLKARPTYYKRKYIESEDGTPVSDEVKELVGIGLIAQECLEINPHCVGTWMDTSNKPADAPEDWKGEERLSIDYQNWTIHLIGSVQEQQKMIDEQKTQITELKDTIQTMMERETIIIDHAKQQETKFNEYKALTEERLNKLALLVKQLMG